MEEGRVRRQPAGSTYDPVYPIAGTPNKLGQTGLVQADGTIAFGYPGQVSSPGDAAPVSNPTPTGSVLNIASTTAETIVAGCDLSITNSATGVIRLVGNFWLSHSWGGFGKTCVIRVRRGGLTGTILHTQNYNEGDVDSTNGHQKNRTFNFTDTPGVAGPTQYVVTVQINGGNLYSDTREFTISETGSEAYLTTVAGYRSPEGAFTSQPGRLYVELNSANQVNAIWYKRTGTGNTGWVNIAAPPEPEALVVAVSDEATALTVGGAKTTFRMPFAMTLSAIRGSLSSASSAGDVTVDVNKSGASILSTKLTIDVGEKTSLTAATPAVLSSTSLADDEEITIDIDDPGANAKGLKITLIGTRG